MRFLLHPMHHHVRNRLRNREKADETKVSTTLQCAGYESLRMEAINCGLPYMRRHISLDEIKEELVCTILAVSLYFKV